MTSSVPVPVTTSGGGGSVGGGTRWCPTPEQVMLLEGMYRGGLKTPTATQIQQITARLSVYGKIQGKNVFYWFQNHKARDRQKLRKKFMALYQQHRLYPLPHQDHQFLPPLYRLVGVEDGRKCKTTINNWKMNQFSSDQSPTCKLMCDCPLITSMMMMDNHGTSPYCTRVPPKTLQLFPLTTTKDDDLKQDDDDDDRHSITTKLP